VFSILYCLARNPEKQARLREEVMTLLPEKDSKITPQTLINIPYLRAVIKESFRLHAPISTNFRAAGENLVLQGYQIEKEVEIRLMFLKLRNILVFRRTL